VRWSPSWEPSNQYNLHRDHLHLLSCHSVSGRYPRRCKDYRKVHASTPPQRSKLGTSGVTATMPHQPTKLVSNL
jgi:hypothetical protein